MEMTGQFHASVTLPPEKEAPFLIGQGDVWAPKACLNGLEDR